MTGAIISRTGTPASARARIIASRRFGVGARGSIARASPASSVVRLMPTSASPCAAISDRISRSRSISAPRVVMVTGCCQSRSTSSSDRVIRCCASIGCQGSVFDPSAIGATR